jgi:hypothetical protein
MTAYSHCPDPYLPLYLATTGTKQEPGRLGWVLGVNTYYVEFGVDAARVSSVKIEWDAVVAMTITVEDTNDPIADTTTYTTSDRKWTPENPSSGFVGVSGGTAAGLTVTVPGGSDGSCMYHIGNSGALRNRLKLVVTVGGAANGTAHAKGA